MIGFVAGLLALAGAPVTGTLAHGPMPGPNPGAWVRDEDYPVSAWRHQNQGAVYYALRVAASGKVLSCIITKPSRWPALDERTCELMMRRANFQPATNDQGEPIESVFAGAVRWRIPGGPPLSDPYLYPYSLVPDSFRNGH